MNASLTLKALGRPGKLRERALAALPDKDWNSAVEVDGRAVWRTLVDRDDVEAVRLLMGLESWDSSQLREAGVLAATADGACFAIFDELVPGLATAVLQAAHEPMELRNWIGRGGQLADSDDEWDDNTQFVWIAHRDSSFAMELWPLVRDDFAQRKPMLNRTLRGLRAMGCTDVAEQIEADLQSPKPVFSGAIDSLTWADRHTLVDCEGNSVSVRSILAGLLARPKSEYSVALREVLGLALDAESAVALETEGAVTLDDYEGDVLDAITDNGAYQTRAAIERGLAAHAGESRWNELRDVWSALA